MSRLNVRVGAMESIKSAEAVAIHKNYRLKGLSSLLTKPALDTKADTRVVSRLGVEHETDFIFGPDENIRERVIGHAALNKLDIVNVLIVDEANFVTVEQAKQLHSLTVSDNRGLGEIPVIALGLRSTAMGEPFLGMATLMAFAKDIEVRDTVCRCATLAWHNTRKMNGEFVFVGEEIAIDEGGKGTVSYESLCSDCYKEEIKKAISTGKPVQQSVIDIMGVEF